MQHILHWIVVSYLELRTWNCHILLGIASYSEPYLGRCTWGFFRFLASKVTEWLWRSLLPFWILHETRHFSHVTFNALLEFFPQKDSILMIKFHFFYHCYCALIRKYWACAISIAKRRQWKWPAPGSCLGK